MPRLSRGAIAVCLQVCGIAAAVIAIGGLIGPLWGLLAFGVSAFAVGLVLDR